MGKWILIIAAIVSGVAGLLIGLYILATRCSRRKDMRKFRSWAFAHRGLHGPAKPENSMAAFRSAMNHGYGVELDVHLLKDGNLAVIHDGSLKRTTGADIHITQLETQDLWEYKLEGTPQTIPTFREVLELFDGKVPMIVELKVDNNNIAPLCETVCKQLENYKGLYCLECFDPRALKWLKKNRPDILRGQLTQNYFHESAAKLPVMLKFIMTYQLCNFLTLPDFVAYRYADRKNFGNFLVKKLWGAGRVTWTVNTPEAYETAKKEGWTIIFENFKP